nr:hypothetical protein [Tanacetum cinerariifolium]
MSNTNNTTQTQTSNTLHNAIMEAGGKDRPPMLAPGNYVKWKSRIKRYIDTKPNHELIHYCLKNPPYKFQWTDKDVPISEGIYNDIYSTVDACPNACEMLKAIKRLKQGESINVQDLKTNLYWQFRKFTSQDGESLESYYFRFYKMMNDFVRNQYDVTNHQVNVHLKQHQNEVNEIRAERLARTANPLALVAQQQPVYHPQNHPTHYTQNSTTRSQQTATRNRGKAIKPKRAKDAAYHKEKMMLCKQEEARFQLNAEQADWGDDTDDESEDQELDAHYIEHPEQSKSVNDTYPIEQDEHNVIINSLDMSYDREQVNQHDYDDDLSNERDLLASLIEKLKCEIDDSKNRNKFLETSNKALVDKLKGEIEDLKIKNISLESSNKHFKEANNELSKANELMYKDLKKFQAELDRHNDVKYASKVEINCAKAKGDLMSYEMEFEKSSKKYTQKINDLNRTILEMKKELFAHQETISILSQQKRL